MKNLVILVGNLGKNPDLRHTGKTYVANFSLATSESFRTSEGKQQKTTEWHNVTAFGPMAETIGKYLTKGSKAYIEGRLRTRKWEKDGVTRYSTEVVATEVKFLDPRAAAASATPPPPPADAMEESDIAF
jgi:single-strand DNA-binding protein